MSQFWKIEEQAGGGFYIVWEGIFTTKVEAEKMLSRMRAKSYPHKINARPVLYQTSRASSGGPVRAERENQ